mmetsp:Transcript_15025/g.22025  ORF Transcript_15025/g.22025 Transcript_15025/m.22025 type:complete len:122 (+) Transcript_15025:3-368(+)
MVLEQQHLPTVHQHQHPLHLLNPLIPMVVHHPLHNQQVKQLPHQHLHKHHNNNNHMVVVDISVLFCGRQNDERRWMDGWKERKKEVLFEERVCHSRETEQKKRVGRKDFEQDEIGREANKQ